MKTIKNFSLVASLAFCITLHSNAQGKIKANIGFGMGIDYGGFGSRVAYLPIDNIGLFAAVGYNSTLSDTRK